MDRIYASGAAGSVPSVPASPSSGYPTAGNPGAGTPATKPGPYWYHMVMEELMTIITAGGVTPAPGALNQVKLALDALYAPKGSVIQGQEGQALSSLGYGQTWQDVTASRAFRTTYYNTTGRPIFVAVQDFAVISGAVGVAITVSGTQVTLTNVGGSGGTSYQTATAIVPPGASYSAISTNSWPLGFWKELR